MEMERIIGVDFGTSTSVVRVKRYNGNEPVDERLFAKPVVFNMGSTIVPTLIRKTGTDTLYGYNAEISKKDSVLYQSFKVQLESTNPEQKSLARSLTADFLKYLGKVYREQSEGGHLGEVKDTERTIISYPVKWSQDTKDFMIESAKSAGFPNVTGMDEASAAIIASTLQNEKTLKSRGYLKPGIPLNVLLLDMGAGTTDLVLCKYTPGFQNEILCTYPKDGVILFGGREIDALLGQYIAEKVPNEFRSTILKKIGQEKYKAWKESVVSHTLQNAEAVKEFGTLDELAELLGFDVDFALDRTEFESLLNVYLRGLPELVCGCLKEAGMTGDEIDLVILTGGHSQWYFVKDILAGANKEYGDCNLTKIEADCDRIVSISLPQETVALGLAFSGLDLNIVQEKADLNGNTNRTKEKDIFDSDDAFMMHIDDVLDTTVSNTSVVTTVTGRIERGKIQTGNAVKISKDIYGEKVYAVVHKIKVDKISRDSAKQGDVIHLDLRVKRINSNFIQKGQIIYAYSSGCNRQSENVNNIENSGFQSTDNTPDSEKEYLEALSLFTDITGLEEVLKHTFEKVKTENLDYAKKTRDTTKEFFKSRYRLLCNERPDRFLYDNNYWIGNTIGKMEFPDRSTYEKTVKSSGILKGGGAGAATGAVAGSFIPVIGTAMGAIIGGVIGLAAGAGSDNTKVDNSISNTMNFIQETVLPELTSAFRSIWIQK